MSLLAVISIKPGAILRIFGFGRMAGNWRREEDELLFRQRKKLDNSHLNG